MKPALTPRLGKRAAQRDPRRCLVRDPRLHRIDPARATYGYSTSGFHTSAPCPASRNVSAR